MICTETVVVADFVHVVLKKWLNLMNLMNLMVMKSVGVSCGGA